MKSKLLLLLFLIFARLAWANQTPNEVLAAGAGFQALSARQIAIAQATLLAQIVYGALPTPTAILATGASFQALSDRDLQIAIATMMNQMNAGISNGTFYGNGAGLTNVGGVVVNVYTNGNIVGPRGSTNVSATTRTAGHQEAIDMLPKGTAINSPGGGTIIFEAWPVGGYMLQTNVVWDNTFPMSLCLAYPGEMLTKVIYTGPTNTAVFKPKVVPATETRVNGYNLDVGGATFSSVTNATNIIFQLDEAQFVNIHDCTFVPYYVLTNATWGDQLSLDGVNFTQLPGQVAIAINPSVWPGTYNGTYSIHDNKFYGMACAFFNGGIRGSFLNNFLFACGGWYSGSYRFHTNAWTANIGGENTPYDYTVDIISSGATVISPSSGPILIANNRFAICGPTVWAALCQLVNNSYESCQLRALYDVSGTYTFSTDYSFFEMGLGGPAGGYGANALPMDSAVTNSATKAQPNFVNPSSTSATANIAGIKVLTSNVIEGEASGSNRVAITGILWGDGRGLTNVPPNTTNFTIYAAGTAYTLTGSSAALDFGTTDPVLTINQAGTYLIHSNVGVKYNGASYVAAQTVTFKLRRTNNTAADLTNGSRAVELPVLTTFTGGDVMTLPPVIYTATSGDTITIYGILSATPSAGSVQTDSAEVVAVRLY